MGHKELVSQIMSEFGSKGGTARAKRMTKAERSEAASKAAKARWAKAKKNAV